jgi:hypothetical protein
MKDQLRRAGRTIGIEGQDDAKGVEEIPFALRRSGQA